MFRPTRLTLHWLLWLVIALLPLRGWAQVQMAMADIPIETVVAVEALSDTPPCHPHAVDVSGAEDGTLAPQSACAHCDLCHAGFAFGPLPLPDMPDLPHAAPTPATSPSAGPQMPERLFRPPRALTV